MKIVIVNTFYSPDVYGGAEISIQKLAEQLVKEGNEVNVIVTSNEDKIEIINNVKIIRIRINNIYDTIEVKGKSGLSKGIYKIIDLYNIFNYKKLKKIIEEINPDVIHTNNLYGISTIIWKIAKQKNIKIVHTVRDYALLCPFVHLSCIDKECKVEKLCSLYKKNRNEQCSQVDEVVYISNTVEEIFNNYNYFNKSDSNVIYNSIDFNIDKVRDLVNKKINKAEKITKFVYIGTLDCHKGIDLLLEAFSEINNENIILNIAGKGPLEDLVKKYDERYNNIFYKGFLKQDEIDNFLAEQHILIAPSRWIEPFGRVTLDAYKNALPVIATNEGGFVETVIHEKTGLLFKNGDKSELKKCIKRMTEEKLYIKLLENLENELVKYSLKNHADNYLKVYKK